MPQPKDGDTSESSPPKAKAGGARAKSSSPPRTRAAASKDSGAAASKDSGAPAPRTKSTGQGRTSPPKSSAAAPDTHFEAAAQRIRKLNEQIIEAGREAGETTLTSYEKALKAMADTLDRRAGSTDIDWISNLATTQAKFLRDVTDAWTSAARKILKQG
jgi:hypothetical protein